MILPKFHSDDVGLNPEVDNKIFSLIKRGKISEVSVLADFISPQNAETLSLLAKQDKSLKVALHVDFVEGRSMLRFVYGVLSGKITGEAIRKEIIRQVTILKKYNLPLHSIDSHRHTHALSPISEVLKDVAEEYGISHLRSYKSIDTHTYIAKLKYTFLKIVSYISYFRMYKKLGLPSSWNMREDQNLTVMSWEGRSFHIPLHKRKTLYIIHPYLSFDSNLSYTQFL